MKIQYIEPWRNHNCTYGKGKLLIWSFTLEDGIGRVDVGCCWLLLIADGCYWLLDDCWLRLGYCWLLLVASGCWMIAGCGWDTASRRESFWILSKSRCGSLAQTSFKIVLEHFEEAVKRDLTKTSFKIVLEYFEEAMKKFGKDKF